MPYMASFNILNMLKEIKKLVSNMLGYSKFFIIIIGVFAVLALLTKIGLEVIRTIVEVLKEYWYITILASLTIIYFTSKSDDKK
jgi:hypothetical protein